MSLSVETQIPRLIFSLNESPEIAGVGRSFVYMRQASGRLPYVRVGDTRRVGFLPRDLLTVAGLPAPTVDELREELLGQLHEFPVLASQHVAQALNIARTTASDLMTREVLGTQVGHGRGCLVAREDFIEQLLASRFVRGDGVEHPAASTWRAVSAFTAKHGEVPA